MGIQENKFHFPVERIMAGYYTDKYFLTTQQILRKDNRDAKALMQIFQRKEAVVCGVEEAVALLRTCAIHPERLEIKALSDGDEAAPWETVMTIEGSYADFAHLETLYLGILARQTRVATNTRKVVKAAGAKPVLFFGARYDHFSVQEEDGYAAHVGGANAVSTDANGFYFGQQGVGTVPHSLIVSYGGDTVAAAIAFDRYMPPEINRLILVDFDNDCVNTSLAVARVLGKRLWGVRLDTSSTLMDKSLEAEARGLKDPSPLKGVSAELVWKVRRALDAEGYRHVKIIVSSGFDAEKIAAFEEAGVPVDIYGVGSSLYRGNYDYTADIVMLDGKPCAKVGRQYNPNPRLQPK